MSALRLSAAMRTMRPAAGARRYLSTPAELLSKYKAREATWAGLAKDLPESLKFLVDESKSHREQFEAFTARQPELVAEICKRKAQNPDAAGIVATTDEPRDPATCKYTVEGSLAHTVMTDLFTYERFDKFLYEGLEVKLTAEDKAKINQEYAQWMEDVLGKVKGSLNDMPGYTAAGSPPVDLTPPPLPIPDKLPYKTVLGL